jgi:hypothetical protein
MVKCSRSSRKTQPVRSAQLDDSPRCRTLTAVRLARAGYLCVGGGKAVVMRFTQRIPVSTVSGAEPTFSIAKADWQKIEIAYGYAVPTNAREQIHDATVSFLRFAESEQVARPVSEARQQLATVKKAAVDLLDALFENPQDDGWDARQYATHLLERCFREAGITRRSQALSSLSTSIISLIVACDHAQAHLEKNQGRREGETWENWVCRVTEILQQHQLPTGVRKDTDKNKAGKPSPFVSLIYELQHLIPEGRRKSTHSLFALAEAIARARQPHRVT